MALPLETNKIRDDWARRALEVIGLQFPLGPANQLGAGPTTVATLPTGTQNGQDFYYRLSGGGVWHFKYDPTSGKWDFAGGPPLTARVDTSETTASAAYVALTTVGPSITVPFAGDYLIEVFSEQLHSAAAQVMLHSYDIGGTGAADADAAIASSPAANMPFTVPKPRLKTGLAASTALVSKYRTTAATATFRFREMRVLPVRVG